MTQINQLPSTATVAATDVLPIWQATTTRQATTQQVVAGAVTVLPTTLPASVGVLWSNGGALCLSQP